MTQQSCPCGRSQEYSQCCEPFLRGQRTPQTPEELMRSRYTAFVQQDIDYIRKTTDPQTFHLFDFPGNADWAKKSEFVSLQILNASQEGNKGLVEFKAQYRQRGDESVPPQVHHELSQFRRQGGRWYFRNGKLIEDSAPA